MRKRMFTAIVTIVLWATMVTPAAATSPESVWHQYTGPVTCAWYERVWVRASFDLYSGSFAWGVRGYNSAGNYRVKTKWTANSGSTSTWTWKTGLVSIVGDIYKAEPHAAWVTDEYPGDGGDVNDLWVICIEP